MKTIQSIDLENLIATQGKQYFITGTDTDAGKTLLSSALLRSQTQQGRKSMGIKPMAAGCELHDGELKNDDAIKIMTQASINLPYASVNPVALEPAIAPHIAAAEIGKEYTVAKLAEHCEDLMRLPHDFCLIEGAGGWLVPVNESETLADLAEELKLPVILLVPIRLGCINHALLSAQAIRAQGLELAAWVANVMDENGNRLEENIQSIAQRIGAPMLLKVEDLTGLTEEQRVAQVANKLLG